MMRGPPPSKHTRVFKITGPNNLVEPQILGRKIEVLGDCIHASVNRNCWHGTSSIVYSFSSVTMSVRAWVCIVRRMELALTSVGKLREEGWGQVHLDHVPDPCEPKPKFPLRKRRHSF
ncbi:hypothetical protein ANO14919_071470 [Xylariales sp. No.14919]|nr:hypothetical protein ANO14919_071470 [Xylariales sp. No.14919]